MTWLEPVTCIRSPLSTTRWWSHPRMPTGTRGAPSCYVPQSAAAVEHFPAGGSGPRNRHLLRPVAEEDRDMEARLRLAGSRRHVGVRRSPSPKRRLLGGQSANRSSTAPSPPMTRQPKKRAKSRPRSRLPRPSSTLRGGAGRTRTKSAPPNTWRYRWTTTACLCSATSNRSRSSTFSPTDRLLRHGPAQNLKHPKLLRDPQTGFPPCSPPTSTAAFPDIRGAALVEDSVTKRRRQIIILRSSSTVALRPDLPLAATKIEVGTRADNPALGRRGRSPRLPRTGPGGAVGDQEPAARREAHPRTGGRLIRGLTN